MRADHIFQALRELCLDMSENVTEKSLGGNVVPDIQGQGVCKGKCNGLPTSRGSQVYVEGEGGM